MTTQTQTPTFRLHALASTVHVAGRLAVLAAIVAVLAGGFLAGLSPAPRPQADQVAHTPATCAALPC